MSTFDLLFRQVLLPGGTYIIEDIETSYWSRNGLYGYTTRYGYHHENSCIEVRYKRNSPLNLHYSNQCMLSLSNNTIVYAAVP